MSQAAREAGAATEKKQKEYITSPEQFKEKYDAHQKEILEHHNRLFDTLANPFHEEELANSGRPALNDPAAWNPIPPTATFHSAANEQKVQDYTDELQHIREQQQQELKALLDKHHTDIETLEAAPNSYQVSTAMAQLEVTHKKKLGDLQKQHETQINQFITHYKPDISVLYGLDAKSSDAKEKAMQNAVKKTANNQLHEQAKVYQDAKNFIDIACNYDRQQLIEKYRSDQDIIQVGKQGSQFAQLPNMRRDFGLEDALPLEDAFNNPLLKGTLGLASLGGVTKMGVGMFISSLAVASSLWGIPVAMLTSFVLGKMGFGITAYTANITEAGLSITPKPTYGYTTFLGIQYLQEAIEAQGVAKDTERWLARNQDWSKPAVVHGDPHVAMAIALTLVKHGFDPDTHIRFKENQPTTEEMTELRKEHQKWLIKQQQSPHQLGADGAPIDKITPFATKNAAQTSVSMLSS